MTQTDRLSFTLVGLGEVLWDMLPGGRRLGGAPANFAYHAQALGATGIVASCVGRDPAGRDIRRRLRDLGLSARWVAVDPAHPTGAVDVKLDSHGTPSYVIREEVAWDFLPFSPNLRRIVSGADAVCFGTLCLRAPLSRRTILRALDAARGLRVLDVNFRQSYFTAELMRRLLPRCDVIKLNDEELPVLARLLGLRRDGDAAPRILERWKLRLLALTRGSRGSLLYTSDTVSRHPGYPTRVADTVGAGDAFTAALTIAMLRNEPIEAAHDYASRVASFVCSRRGATPAMPARFRHQRFFHSRTRE